MINYGKNKNVLAGNFQKTIRCAARLLERLEYLIHPWIVHLPIYLI